MAWPPPRTLDTDRKGNTKKNRPMRNQKEKHEKTRTNDIYKWEAGKNSSYKRFGVL
jgi:hypothetical protein